MIRDFLRKLTDVTKDCSILTKLRLNRMFLFRQFLSGIPKPRRILDVGGEEIFWVKMRFVGDRDSKITLLNLSQAEVHYPNFESVIGDARNMSEFKDSQFDIVFSNSVIE